MSRLPFHALIWSDEQRLYELYTKGQLQLRFRPAEGTSWLAWLREATSFAFHGKGGSLNVYLERRPRGGAYWYAYHTKEGRTRKRYLGRTDSLSLARLEETARTLLDEQKPTQALDQGMLVLSSKLSPPHFPNALVERERLLRALDGALSTPLTLLSAPAGFGKTTLLATWARRQTIRVAWLSLDDLDTTPTRFWVALIVALRSSASLSPQFGNTVLALLESPQPPPLSSCLTVLLSELESRESHLAPLVLVLDDYQVIEDPAIHQSLAFFLEHPPAKVHLILASRVDPDLPLSRFRVRGQLTEIRADELRFSLEEASQYLVQLLSPTLSEEEVQRLLSRTEGWIAGLQLAALAMQKRADRTAFLEALTGSQRYLLDYVQQEILARLPERVRDFLLHSAILSQMSASVCQAVTGAPTRAASQQLLVFLERNNLFLVPLDEERRNYRLHELFREALLSVLHASQPELMPLLHRRAAAFYEAQGAWHEAIAHRFAAADYSTAARLMEQTVEQFWMRGEAATMVRWALALPERHVREHARLLLTTTFYLLCTVINTAQEQRARGQQQARQLMAQVETTLRDHSGRTSQETSVGVSAALFSGDLEAHAAEEALLHRRLRLLHLFLVLSEVEAGGEYERVSHLQQEIEEERNQDEEAIWQIILLSCSFILHYAFRQEGARLVPQLLEAYERANRSGSRYAIYKVRQFLALAAVEAGHLHLAYEESWAALDLIKQLEGFALLKGYFEVALAQVLYQWNRLEEARVLLHALVHDAAAWQQLDLLAWGYVELMQVALVTEDQSLAEVALHRVEELVQSEHFGFYPSRLPILRAQWWLAQGHLEAVSYWAAGVVFPEGPWDRNLYDTFPIVIRVYFVQRSFREAVELLERFSAHLDRPTNTRITITFLAQYLVALHQTGKSEQAHVIAARLFALTEPEGYLRVYLDEGELMREALQMLFTPYPQEHEWAASTRTYISQLLAAFEREAQGTNTLLEAAATHVSAPSPAPQLSAVSSASGISLTKREQEVLRLLAAGASNQDIAQALVISLDTVKKHVSNLLGKLGASSRTQAVAQARARSLL